MYIVQKERHNIYTLWTVKLFSVIDINFNTVGVGHLTWWSPVWRGNKGGRRGVQTSFCNLHFNFVVDLLLPHETAGAQRKQQILSK